MPQPQLHAWSCKSLTAYNFCYEYAKDFYFQVDQKYEIINENDKKNWKSNQNHGCGSLKPLFSETLCRIKILFINNDFDKKNPAIRLL